jgi:hypothetical protein
MRRYAKNQFQQRHYIIIADALSKLSPKCREEVVAVLRSVFKADNWKFSSELFIKAVEKDDA